MTGEQRIDLDRMATEVHNPRSANLDRLSTPEIVRLINSEDAGVAAIVYTDISRDGMMQGVNVEATVKMARAINIPVIASGGITSMDDVKALSAVADEGIMGAITGRAIYEGTIDLKEAQAWLDQQ